MSLERKTTSVTIGGQEIIFETGKIARQANGAVVVHCGETTIFCSACAKFDPEAQFDFLPLRVDYQEKFSSAGKTLGGFMKREGRPSQRETLMARLIDRPIRPMFEDGFQNDIQILSYVWSYDGIHQPEPLALCAASAALAISDIPLKKSLAGVRVAMINDEFVINPTKEQMEKSSLDLLMAGTHEAVLMIEGSADFLSEEQVIEAIYAGHAAIRTICETIDTWAKEVGKKKIRDTLRTTPQDAVDEVKRLATPLFEPALRLTDKDAREAALSEAKKQVIAELFPESDEKPRFEKRDVSAALKATSANLMRTMALNENVRCDGRGPTDVRAIDIETGILPRTHGSALFTRGETQAMAVCTLGGESMAQRYETLDADASWRFYLQYFFPPFSVGEVGRSGPPGRREVGHGKLAEKALLPTLPKEDVFPYTIRLESNITESNGSSSMASICGGCLAMMDAGVPLQRPVAGIAMGLILEEDGRHMILSDILGIEDALGDMDFKIAGDANGITTFQMDIKIEGITPEIMEKALAQAKDGRLHILRKMLEVLPRPREDLSDHAPRIEILKITPSKIGDVIGPGGKVIRSIIEQTGVTIDIEDDGSVKIGSPDRDSIEKAKGIIQGITANIEIGTKYKGKIAAIVPFGLFVEVLPGKEGLCHISEYDLGRVDNLDKLVNVGDEIEVKVIDINERGQVRLSRKALLSPEKAGAQ
ncbi:Polyribonucleotide nucleotidyltransferase [Chlamydiales bacterium SCGC AG-110-P3]|nr:Polyribonucleotide nucleotidyltransferase [Chlamydiales bacterium SCGC AG-110-P3]